MSKFWAGRVLCAICVICAVCVITAPIPLDAGQGKMINPISDVSWECLFPITVSGVNVTPKYKDQTKHTTRICSCAGVPPKIGIPITFWEPLRLVDVTRHAYTLVGLGGISVGPESVKNRGSVGIVGDGPSQSSFYHVHVYQFPIMYLLGLFEDFACVEKASFEVPYMSELDPSWKNERYATIFNAEAALFGNPLAQTACIADCLACTAGKPTDKLFWCAGCQGSLYPFTGTVAHHVGPVQASSLLVHRVLAKLHRMGLVKGYRKNDYCKAHYLPIIKKSLYKTQLVYPKAQRSGPCHPLGKTDILWGAGKSFPEGGEDFVYLVWSKKQCCLDAVKIATTVATGGAG